MKRKKRRERQMRKKSSVTDEERTRSVAVNGSWVARRGR